MTPKKSRSKTPNRKKSLEELPRSPTEKSLAMESSIRQRIQDNKEREIEEERKINPKTIKRNFKLEKKKKKLEKLEKIYQQLSSKS